MWKDVSSYSQGEKDRTPKSFSKVASGVKVVVTRHIHFPPDVWLARCDPWFSLLELNSKDIEDAKKEAIEIVVANLRAAIDGLMA